MRPKTLDHVAYWLSDRDAVAGFVTAHLGMHVIERTERFTLVGSDARHGKLTLFAAEGPRERGALLHVALRVSELEPALAQLPPDAEVERPRPGEAYVDLGEGVRLGLVEAETAVEYDLDHVALVSARSGRHGGGVRVTGIRRRHRRVRPAAAGSRSAARYVEFEQGDPGSPERPLLNHIAVLVDSADEHIEEADELGIEIDDVVDAREHVCGLPARAGAASASSTSSTSRRSR